MEVLTPEQMTKSLQDINSMVKAFNDKLEQNAKNPDGVTKAELAALESKITEIVGVKQQMDRLAAATQRYMTGENDPEREAKNLELKGKRNEFLRSFAKNMTAGLDLTDFAKMNNIDLKAMSIGSTPDGGYTVIPTVTALIKTRFFETSPVRELATVTEVSGNELDVLVDEDQATSGGWVGETTSRSTTGTPQIKKITVVAHEQYAYPLATQKLIDDSIVDIESWLAGKLADILGRTENTAFVAGTGVASPMGLLSYSAWSVNGTYEYNKIEQIVSGTSAVPTYVGLVNTQNALKEIYQGNANWLMKRATFGKCMQIVDGQSRPIFNLAYDKNTGLQMTMLGAPVRFADDMQAAAASSLSIGYGDIRRTYQIVDKLGLRILRDPYSNKPSVGFYTIKRTGGAVVNFESFKINKLST